MCVSNKMCLCLNTLDKNKRFEVIHIFRFVFYLFILILFIVRCRGHLKLVRKVDAAVPCTVV